jgi:hypothetical protein
LADVAFVAAPVARALLASRKLERDFDVVELGLHDEPTANGLLCRVA